MSVPANFFDTYTLVASPTAAAETVVALLGGVGELLPGLAVNLAGWVNLTPDTDATDVELTIRRDSVSGAIVAGPFGNDDVITTAGTGATLSIEGVDFPGNFAGAIYVLTITCVGANSASTVNAVGFHARTC